MGIVADQMKDVNMIDGSTKTAAVETVLMWIGPRNKKEIDKALAGNPTIIPCAVGDNINDGRGVQGYRERKRFMTLEEMHRWQKAQKPEEKKFPCPYCDEFEGNTATALVKHIAKIHPPDNLKSTPDFDKAAARRLAEQLQPEVEEGNVKNQVEDEGLAEIVTVEPDTQCRAIKPDGNRCGKQAKDGSEYCGIASHQEQDA